MKNLNEKDNNVLDLEEYRKHNKPSGDLIKYIVKMKISKKKKRSIILRILTLGLIK